MNKEEILAKSRNENTNGDERELRIFADASKIGMAVGGVLSACILSFSRIIHMPILGLAAWTVYFSMFGSRRLYQFLKTKENVRLAQAIVGIAVGLACLLGMIIMGLRQ